MKKKTFYFLVAIGAAIWGVHSCASVGTPVGGVSDFDPPVPLYLIQPLGDVTIELP